MNILDLSVFPCMSRWNTAKERNQKGIHILSKNDIWEIVLEAWEKLQSYKILSYVQAYRIAGKVVEAEGGNGFFGISSTVKSR